MQFYRLPFKGTKFASQSATSCSYPFKKNVLLLKEFSAPPILSGALSLRPHRLRHISLLKKQLCPSESSSFPIIMRKKSDFSQLFIQQIAHIGLD